MLHHQRVSARMRAVQQRNTGPELRVRQALHALGFRFRLHRRDLPGRPDIVLPKYKTVVFVHGCYWHRHAECRKATIPKSNLEYWHRKFNDNMRRDRRNERALEGMGWRCLVVWQCQTDDRGDLETLLRSLLNSPLRCTTGSTGRRGRTSAARFPGSRRDSRPQGPPSAASRPGA